MAQTLKALLDYVKDLRPALSFSDTTLTRWVNHIEAQQASEVLLLHKEDIPQYSYAEDSGTELMIGAPHERIYELYLLTQIDYYDQEFNHYNDELEEFNRCYVDYTRWVAQHIDPAYGHAERDGYYLSAYAIAVKHGYTGTEADWLQSLRGERGEQGPVGPVGASIVAMEKTAQTADLTTYTITLSDGKKFTFTVPTAKGEKGDKGDTGATGQTGAQGAQGEPGIVVQEQQPTDPTHPVWVNPNGTPSGNPGGGGTGDITSPEIGTIRVLMKSEYDALSVKDARTLYLVEG